MQVVDRVIAKIAARQHGLITRTQLLAAGVAADAVRWRVRAKRLEPIQRGVYRVGPLVARRARQLAAVLACGRGAVVSHRSAAILWGLCADRATVQVDVTVPHADRGRRPGIRAHRVRALRTDEVTELDAIPITTIARTIFDLASVIGSGEMRQIFALATREHDAQRAGLLELIARYPKRPGVSVLRALLDDESPVLTRSEAEERLLQLIAKAQLPRPEVNAWVESYEADLVWRAQRLVVEVDGFAFHSSRASFESDRRRDATLLARGYRVMRITAHQIMREPEAMLVRLAQAID